MSIAEIVWMAAARVPACAVGSVEVVPDRLDVEGSRPRASRMPTSIECEAGMSMKAWATVGEVSASP